MLKVKGAQVYYSRRSSASECCMYNIMLIAMQFCILLPSALMRSEGTVVGSVCLSVTQHLTSPMFVRLTNDTTYLTGNEGQKICAFFSENAPLQSKSGSSIVYTANA